MTGALWSSGFRPFFLLGAGYGPLVVLGWVPVWAGWIEPGDAAVPGALWHGHELLYGFASAFICGFVLTALPSWVGTPEVKGPRLVALTVAWVAARIAAWSSTWLAPEAVAALDLLTFLALAALVLPGLLHAARPGLLALVPILLGFVVANAIYHYAIAHHAPDLAQRALEGALNLLVVLFSVVGGLLTPIFTEATLRQRDEDAALPIATPIDVIATLTALAFAAAEWADVPRAANGAVGCVAAFVHGVRLCRWRTSEIVTAPLILMMHVGYAWLVAAMALRGLADAFGLVPRASWIHAFTVGALGAMMLALLHRIALRHTGRAVSPSPIAVAGMAIMGAAGVLRVAASILDGAVGLLIASAAAWALPFMLFLIEHAPKLWRPSLPREEARAAATER